MPWVLFAVGVVLVLLTVPALVVVQHWMLLFPTFFVSWLGTGLAGWWMVLIPATTVTLAAAGGLSAWPGWVGLALALASAVGLYSQWRRARAGVLAFDTALARLDLEPRGRVRRTSRSMLLPMSMRSGAVERIKNVRYADGARNRHLLDVYRPTSGTSRAPVLLQIHGGAWMVGTKNTQGRPLMNALAAAGWVCVAINYRLSPWVKHPEHLVDCKLAMRWIREHIAEYGGDPDRVVVTGGSAGGHLAAMVALTADDPRYQPGFEHVDTSVVAAVPVYGAYDLEELFALRWRRVGRRVSSFMGRLVVGASPTDPDGAAAYRDASPVHHVHPGAPPFLIVHGSLDNLVPVQQARRLAGLLEDAGVDTVLVELRGAPHAFDVFHSTWADTSVDGLVRYLSRLSDPATSPVAADATAPSADAPAASDPRTMARTAPS